MEKIIDSRNDIRLILQIASVFLDKWPVNIVPVLGKGCVNKVFIVEAGKEKVVIRTRDDSSALDEYKKEAWCIEKAAGRSVPVSEVITVGTFENSAFMIQKYIAGDEGRDSLLPGNDIWRQLGKYAKLIHSIKVAGLGLKFSNLIEGNSRKAWLKYIDYNIDSLNATDALLQLNVITEPQSKIVRDIFKDLREKTFDFGLNHGDFSLKNVIIDESGKVNLLDWGSAEASVVPHHDLIQMLKMNMLEKTPDVNEIQAFLDGYGISQTEFIQMRPDLESLLLLRAFDKLRWAIDWSIETLDEYVSHAKDAVEKCMSEN